MTYDDRRRLLAERRSHPMGRWLIGLSIGATILALCVVVLGAWTRLSDAGLGCPDWPGCYGFLTVPVTDEQQALANARFPDDPVIVERAWPEMVHRYFASFLGLVVLIIAAVSWYAPRTLAVPRKLPLFLVALVVVQGIFGMWTVTWKLWPQVVTLHLLGGFSTTALLWLLSLRLAWPGPAQAQVPDDAPRRAPVKLGLGLGIVAVLVMQITLGGWTSSNYAALACPDLPTCQGQWWPDHLDFQEGFNVLQEVGPSYLGGLMDGDARIAIHLTHRIGAIICTLAIVGLLVALWRAGGPGLRQLAAMCGLILGVQVALGLSNVWLVLPIGVATAHNGVAAVLLLTLVSVNYALHLRR